MALPVAIAAYEVLFGGHGFAINAHLEFGTSCSKVCPMNDATCFVITEEGTARCYIYPYVNLATAKLTCNSWMCCWVLFDLNGAEHGSGGIGFAQNTCRENGLAWLVKYLKTK